MGKDSNKLAGASFEPSAKCKHEAKTYGRLLEPDIFPEVGTAWSGSGPPRHGVLPKDERIDFLAAPSIGSDVLHTVSAPQVVKGWVGEQSKWWSPHFISMLVYSIGDNAVWKDTAVFFEHRKAKIHNLPSELDMESKDSSLET